MKKTIKTKKRPKLKLPKYGNGVVTSAADQQAIDAEMAATSGSKNTMNSSDYAQYATAATGAAMYATNIDNKNMTTSDKAAAGRNTIAQVDPTGITGMANMIADPIKKDAEQFDETGQLKNEGYAQAMAITGSLFSPSTALTAALDGTWSLDGKAYTNSLEKAETDRLNALKPKAQAPVKDYRQDAVWQAQNQHVEYAMGGLGQPNAELEKQEVMQFPDGTTGQVNGPSHEQGGVPVNLPPATKVYSDKLRLPGSKLTVAKEAEKYKTNKEEKVLADEKADITSKKSAQLIMAAKQRKLDQLFAAQEAFKQSKVQKYAERMGVTLPQAQPQMRNGGSLPKYQDGILTPMDEEDVPLRETSYLQGMAQDDSYMRTGASKPSPYYQTPMDEIPMRKTPTLGADPGMEPILPPTERVFEKEPDPRKQPNWNNIAGYGSSMVAQNAGNIWDLYKSGFGKKYDKEDYGQLTPELLRPTTLDNREGLRDADRMATVSRESLKGAVGGNGAAYMAALTGNQSTNALNKARIRQDYANRNTEILNGADASNAGIKNNVNQYNKELSIREKTANAQNKARSEDMAAHAIRDIGSKSASGYKDYKSGEMDEKKIALIKQYFPNYDFNPETYEFYSRAAESKSKGGGYRYAK